MVSTFPSDFIWGASSAAHQIEGGNVNADIWPVEWSSDSLFKEPSKDACDGYHRFEEDISLLAASGLRAYRFTVEWARIEPEPGWFSRAALDHYRRVAHSCVDHGVTPMVTLHHFTSPRWLARAGGWEAEDAIERFGRYADAVARHLGDLVPWVCTINEANVVSVVAGHDLAQGPMAWLSPEVDVMAAAHRAAASAIKRVNPAIGVGWSLAMVDLQSVAGGEDRRDRVHRATQRVWLEASRGDDFVGVQTYSRERLGAEGSVGPPAGAELMQSGTEVYPEALEATVRLAAGIAGVPVFVTENGIATDDDAARVRYAQTALGGLARCLSDGVEVLGYLHWSLLDSYEWMHGFRLTFGLIAVDFETFERTPRPSLAWLGSCARSNDIVSAPGRLNTHRTERRSHKEPIQ